MALLYGPTHRIAGAVMVGQRVDHLSDRRSDQQTTAEFVHRTLLHSRQAMSYHQRQQPV